jgi:hypothetical protein
MLQAAHLTLAPKATRVSISTAVWALMWVHPTILAFFRGLSSLARFLSAIIPGISENSIKACRV